MPSSDQKTTSDSTRPNTISPKVIEILQEEIVNRKRLRDDILLLENEKLTLLTQQEKKQRLLSSLSDKVKNVLEASRPLLDLHTTYGQDQLLQGDFSSSDTSSQRALAKHLPVPLHILYSQTKCLHSLLARDDFSVKVTGVLDQRVIDAQKQIDAQYFQTLSSFSSSSSSSSSDNDNALAQKQIDAQYFQTLSSFSSSSSSSSSVLDETMSFNDQMKKLLFPLSVQLILDTNFSSSSSSSSSVKLTFSFLARFNVILVRSSKEITPCLFDLLVPNDDGSFIPNQCVFFTQQTGLPLSTIQALQASFAWPIRDECRNHPFFGRAFIWAQRVCGLDPMRPRQQASTLNDQCVDALHEHSALLEKMVETLFIRLKSNQTTKNHIECLMKSQTLPAMPTTKHTKIVSFQSIQVSVFEKAKSQITLDRDITNSLSTTNTSTTMNSTTTTSTTMNSTTTTSTTMNSTTTTMNDDDDELLNDSIENQLDFNDEFLFEELPISSNFPRSQLSTKNTLTPSKSTYTKTYYAVIRSTSSEKQIDVYIALPFGYPTSQGAVFLISGVDQQQKGKLSVPTHLKPLINAPSKKAGVSQELIDIEKEVNMLKVSEENMHQRFSLQFKKLIENIELLFNSSL
eukprot:CAMPEP_0201561114 /NCGR_PEP_ID=MMETSP0173_2-20130828/78620_1 /ASSEMBLY_ACC=CAM_ASM_000268 /TAXON_ID=218659 /ORGANISM="Vexillifera sp., Strain DIVA3 564/2" /LENGTH=626 /DNA_ID=CAMNT_0047975591 /DNA_START=19 /DNA_END=1899 /DNA_ORIENTATION=-